MPAGDEVMMADAKTCNKEYNVPRNACENRECVADCTNAYGNAASGRCGAKIKPDDLCVCTYPC